MLASLVLGFVVVAQVPVRPPAGGLRPFPNSPPEAFVHRVVTAQNAGFASPLTHASLDGQPNAIAIVNVNRTPSGTPGPVPTSPVGVTYTSGKWHAFQRNRQPLPEGTTLNVLVVSGTVGGFVHRSAAANVSGPGTLLDHPALNGKPDAVVLVCPSDPAGAIFSATTAAPGAAPPGGVGLPRPIGGQPRTVLGAGQFTAAESPLGVKYENGKWQIVNLNGAIMPAGQAFNVAIVSGQALVATGPAFQGGVVQSGVAGSDSAQSLLFVTATKSPKGQPAEIPSLNVGAAFAGGKWGAASMSAQAIPEGAGVNTFLVARTPLPTPGRTVRTNVTPIAPRGGVNTIRPGLIPPAPGYITPPGLEIKGGLAGWTKTGTAFASQPTFGDNVMAQRVFFSPLGGDYWHIPYPIGNQGKPWIGTYENRPTEAVTLGTIQGDAPTGSITSPEFTISKPWASFLVAGGKEPSQLKVELVVDGRANYLATGHNSEILRRAVFNFTPYLGKTGRLVITDAATGNWGHINFADFRLHDEDPRPGLIIGFVGGGFSDYVDPEAPVFGLADTHAHPAANLGFGNNLYFGSPIGPMPTVLRTCFANHGKDANDLHQSPGSILSVIFKWADVVISTLGSVFTTGSLDPLKSILYDAVGSPLHSGVGFPALQSYQYNNALHQHMHVDWIKRAYEGGMRLVVAEAVHNSLLAQADPKSQIPLLNDKEAGDAQIALIKTMAAQNSAWMEIALTPADARRIIRNNKLCIVLGLEVDAIGNFRKESDCTDATLDAELKRLYALGVRHILPIHLANSPFGGSGVYGDLFNINNLFQQGGFYRVRDASAEGIGFVFNLDVLNTVSTITGALNMNSSFLTFRNAPGWTIGFVRNAYLAVRNEYMTFKAHANAQGLTNRGLHGIDTIMNLGMILDIDHFSLLATNDVMPKVEAKQANGLTGYPVIAGHTSFRDTAFLRSESLSPHDHAAETDRLGSNVDRIYRLGGMVSPITNPRNVKRPANSPVANDCPGTSKSLAQQIHYAVSRAAGNGVGIGTDMAMLGGFGPRFGTDPAPSAAVAESFHDVNGRSQDTTAQQRAGMLAARRGFAFAQTNGVRYDTPIQDYRRYRFFWSTATSEFAVYTEEQRDFWEALAIWASDTPTDVADQPDLLHNRSLITMEIVKNFALGLRSLDPAFINQNSGDPLRLYFVQRRAAFILKNPGQRNRGPGTVNNSEIPEVIAMANRLALVWQQWNRMTGSNAPLKRLVHSGTLNGKPYTRDFDINVDGLCHYGMIPDAMQDLKNVGLQPYHFRAMFNSAESYIRMWEKAHRMKTQ